MTSSASPLYTKIKETALAYASNYEQDKLSKDIKALSATLSPDCKRYYAPASVLTQLPSLAAGETNQAYEDHMAIELGSVWTKWDLRIEDLVVDEHQHKAVIRMTHICTSQHSKVYDFQFVYFLSFTETGDKINKIVEYLDTGLLASFMEDQKEFIEKLESLPNGGK